MSEHSKIEWTESDMESGPRAARRSAPAASTATPKPSRSASVGVPAHPYTEGFDPRLIPDKLLEPLRWSGGRTVFVNSMSDLFQDPVPDEYIAAVATVMLRADWHLALDYGCHARRVPPVDAEHILSDLQCCANAKNDRERRSEFE